MATAFTPATHMRCNSPRSLPSFVPDTCSKPRKVVALNAASNCIKLQAGRSGRFCKPLVVTKRWTKRDSIVRCATSEEIEAVKSSTESEAKGRMEKAIEALKSNFASVRTGRANPAMLDKLEVEYHAIPVPLKSIAQISTPNASSLVIQPYDKTSLKAIEKAILKSSYLGMTPNNDGEVIRLTLPTLTSERRKELLKVVSKQAEEAKVAVRNIRRDANKSYQKLEKEKKLSEDNVKDLCNDVQKLTDEYIKKIDSIFKEKEKDLMTV